MDMLGARRTLWPTLVVLAVLVGAMALSPSVKALSAVAFLIEFAATPVFPAHTQFIRRWWPVELQSEGFRIVGTASRCGDVGSKLMVGLLLMIMSWQHASLVAAALSLFTAALSYRFHADSPQARNETPQVSLTLSDVVEAISVM